MFSPPPIYVLYDGISESKICLTITNNCFSKLFSLIIRKGRRKERRKERTGWTISRKKERKRKYKQRLHRDILALS